MKKNVVFGIISGVIAIVGLTQLFGGMANADTYNEYIEKVRPLVEQQDALLEEIDSATDEEGAKRVADWLKRSRQIEAKLKALIPEEDWIAALHSHMVARGESFTAMVESAEKFFTTNQESYVTEMKKHAADAAKHLDAYLAARDKTAAEKDFEVKD
ncbi:MAG: hypothetical protein JXX29_19780 [Deltaproteobacteria bacterium]|nr:hypothetical protein [Deltaproteobacteria bacterium]MBN2673931.1 hypothetical protein [Deltaproteobacteria bacterium]